MTIATEVDDYLESPYVSMETNPTNYWKIYSSKYTHLSMLAKEVLGIPSSSAHVERLFSIAGNVHVFRPERCNLTDNRFEELMFIRCNNN